MFSIVIFLSDNFAIEAKTCASSAASIGNAVTLATSIPFHQIILHTLLQLYLEFQNVCSQIINETNL
jgi:hypothetical protein